MSFYITVENSAYSHKPPKYYITAENFVIIDECAENGEGVAVLFKIPAESYDDCFRGSGLTSMTEFIFGANRFLVKDDHAFLYTISLRKLGVEGPMFNRLLKANINSLGDIINHDANYYLNEMKVKRKDFVDLINTVAFWLKNNYHLDVVVWHRVQRALLLSMSDTTSL